MNIITWKLEHIWIKLHAHHNRPLHKNAQAFNSIHKMAEDQRLFNIFRNWNVYNQSICKMNINIGIKLLVCKWFCFCDNHTCTNKRNWGDRNTRVYVAENRQRLWGRRRTTAPLYESSIHFQNTSPDLTRQ